jgi:hypothetical protein
LTSLFVFDALRFKIFQYFLKNKIINTIENNIANLFTKFTEAERQSSLGTERVGGVHFVEMPIRVEILRQRARVPYL